MTKLLAQSSFWVLNKTVTKKLGSLDASLILSMLCDKHLQHLDNELVWLRIEEIEEQTGLTYYTINKAINLLIKKDLIYRERESKVNPKYLYKVNEDKVMELLKVEILTSKVPTSNNKPLKVEYSTSKGGESATHNNNIINNNKNNNNTYGNIEMFNNVFE